MYSRPPAFLVRDDTKGLPHSSAKRLILFNCATAMYALVSSVDHMVSELRVLFVQRLSF